MATHCDVAKRTSETKEHMQEIVWRKLPGTRLHITNDILHKEKEVYFKS